MTMQAMPDEDFSPQEPQYRREHARELAQIPGLLEKVVERAERRATQKSIIDGTPKRELSEETKSYLEAGVRAADKMRAEPDVRLEPIEVKGLESVILLMSRPAILIQNDDFPEPDEPWRVPLDSARPDIRVRVPNVGRIEIKVDGQVQMVATGFVVGDGVVMTNRHVVRAIADQYPDDPNKWKLRTRLAPQINFKAEYNLPASNVFPILDVDIPTHPKLDMGLLRIAGRPSTALSVASKAPDVESNKNIYVVGYPASDNEGVIPAAVLKDIFAGEYGYKRLAPGEFTNEYPDAGVFAHDCSTLGGNSGSCVVDLDSQVVIGLHYSGSYRKSNFAVSLWKLTADPMLTGAGVKFA
jgi:hypothetical protein